MVKPPFKLVLFGIVVFLFQGCQLYYTPPQVQLPSHKEKGDLSFNAQGFYTGSVSTSYAFSNNGFIGASYMGYSSSDQDSINAVNRDYFRVGTIEGGYFMFDTISNLLMSVSGGIGSGRVGDPSTGFDASFNRLYIQPAFGFISERGNFENHLSARISHLSYARQTNSSAGPFNVSFIEPSYTFRAGSEHVKFHMQMGLSLLFTATSQIPVDFIYDPFILGFGIQANLNVLSRTK